MPETFASLLAKLSRADVEFLVAGGVAVFLNGYPRSTFDLDILVEASAENVRRLLGCLALFGEGHARELEPGDFSAEEGAIRIQEDFALDVFTVMRSRTFADLALTARTVEYDGASIPFLSAQSLIELKAASMREKDQLDVAVLRRILRGEEPAEPRPLETLSPESAESEQPGS